MVQFISRPRASVDPSSEVNIAKALEQLSDDWRVIHSVAWQGLRGKKESDGEADFLLINKNAGLIVLEVKGGLVSIEKGQWKSERSDDGRIVDIQNPFEQAAAGKSKLYRWLKDRLSMVVPTMHAVAFPGGRAPVNLGPAATREIVIDGSDLYNMPAAIARVTKHWKIQCSLTEKEIDKVVDLLAPTTAIRRTIADDAYDAEHALIKLTDEQRRAFTGLRRARRAVVYGGPGTGKTLLAGEKAAQLSAEGMRTLLVCYNALLAHALKASKSLANVEVATFHSLCMAAARITGATPSQPIPQSWWEQEAPYQLVEARNDLKDRYDAIVVDEGQDFSQDWIQALLAILRDGNESPFYVFADTNQRLWARNWEPQKDWLPYDLTINCRNTQPIAQKVAAVVSDELNSIGAAGPEPKWSVLKPKADIACFVCNCIADLLESGFEPLDVVVLCEDLRLAKEISQMTAGSTACCRYGGKGIVVESVARFKGLDAAAIILVLSETLQTPDITAYVGFSRARTYLQVIGPTSRQNTSNWAI